jgi:hypothetical protein
MISFYVIQGVGGRGAEDIHFPIPLKILKISPIQKNFGKD